MNELKQDFTFLRDDNTEYKANLFICYDVSGIKLADPKEILSAQEYEKYRLSLTQKKKDDFLLGRYSAKKALSQICEVSQLSDIDISNGVFGQPIVHYKDLYNVQISVAHGDNISASIVFEESHPTAIDIELIDKSKIADIKPQFTKTELALFPDLNISEELFVFILWTAKESLSKILRTGLTIPLNILEINSIKVIGDDRFVCTYSNFLQYQANSHAKEGFIYSITFPKNSRIVAL
jgi:phosphopantetheinyl transferase